MSCACPRAGPLRETNSAAVQGSGPFQPQIVIEQLNGFRRQRQEASLAAFAAHADLRFGKQHIVPIQSQDFCDRSPCSSISPTMARSREVRKLDQNRATSSTDSGTMVRLGVLTRNRLTPAAVWPSPWARAARYA